MALTDKAIAPAGPAEDKVELHSKFFPYEALLREADLGTTPDLALPILMQQLTASRQAHIERVVGHRSFSLAVVMENLYDRGNASAVVRSAEALGFAKMESIEPGEKWKKSTRTTAGADKWVELRRWKTPSQCVQTLRAEGFQIVSTSLSPRAVPLSSIDVRRPTALVMGNEKDGISEEMRQLSDYEVVLPMLGFVQSYNISVAAALACYHVYLERRVDSSAPHRFEGEKLMAERASLESMISVTESVETPRSSGELTPAERLLLKCVYALRTQPTAREILRRKFGSTESGEK